MQEAYWREVEACRGLSVEYGNDVEGTAFGRPTSADPLASSPWNLQVASLFRSLVLRAFHSRQPQLTAMSET